MSDITIGRDYGNLVTPAKALYGGMIALSIDWTGSYSDIFLAARSLIPLIEIKDEGGLYFDYSNLKNSVETVLEHTKRHMNFIRGSKKITELEAIHEGLQKDLLEQLINGKDRERANIPVLSANLKESYIAYQEIKKDLTLIDQPEYLIDRESASIGPGFGSLSGMTIEGSKPKINLINFNTDIKQKQSLCDTFNNLLSHFLDDTYDVVTKKIYAGVVAPLASELERHAETTLTLPEFHPLPTTMNRERGGLIYGGNINMLKNLFGSAGKSASIVPKLEDLPDSARIKLGNALPRYISMFKTFLSILEAHKFACGRIENPYNVPMKTLLELIQFSKTKYVALSALCAGVIAASRGNIFGVNGEQGLKHRSLAPIIAADFKLDTIVDTQFCIPVKSGVKVSLDFAYVNAAINATLGMKNDSGTYLTFETESKFLTSMAEPMAKARPGGGAHLNRDLFNIAQEKKYNTFLQGVELLGFARDSDIYNKDTMLAMLGLSDSKMLISLKSLVFNLLTSIQRVQNELDDVPIYMEVEPDFVKKFKSLHALDPLMPLSSTTMIQNIKPFPGTIDEKLLCGFRSIFSEVESLQIPWVASLCKKAKYTDDPVVFANIQNSLISSLWLSGVFDKHHLLAIKELAKGAAPVAGSAPYGLLTYQYQNSENTLSLTESKNVNTQTALLARGAKGNSDQRLTAVRRNILDLNVNPINVSALYKHVPFLGLFSYAYNADLLLLTQMKDLDRRNIKYGDIEIISNTVSQTATRIGGPNVDIAPFANYNANNRDFTTNVTPKIKKNVSDFIKWSNSNENKPLLEEDERWVEFLMFLNGLGDKEHTFTRLWADYVTFTNKFDIVNFDLFDAAAPIVSAGPIAAPAAAAAINTFPNVSPLTRAKHKIEVGERYNLNLTKYIIFLDTIYKSSFDIIEANLKDEGKVEDHESILKSVSLLHAKI
jgi:hypothetical protein